MPHFKLVLIWTLGLFFAALAHANPAPAGLLGAWKLKSFTIVNSAGETQTWCEGVRGIIIYSGDGYMSASINCAQANASEPAATYQYKLLYAGRFESKDDNHLIHHVQNASDSKMIGQDALRIIEKLNAQELILVGSFGGGQVRLVWERPGL